ncbi:MAG: PQQ-binding-like beta-propeller repeat protein [Prolixibacteraceae bacterium]|jgi:outer membrane protein assembly factor BamB|nr:PQQ-binding-like beta-propeller repeat protein [Prolixibacteraceae bacterium]
MTKIEMNDKPSGSSPDNSPSLWERDQGRGLIARKIAWLSAGFSVIICVLLIVNFIQSKSVNPIESETLKALVERLKSDPQNEALVNEIRAFDLLARKAYFTNQWQLRTGGYLLLLGIIVTVLAVRYVQSGRLKLDEIEDVKKEPSLDSLLARKWILFVGAGLFVLAAVSGVLSYNSLEGYSLSEPEAKTDVVPEISSSSEEKIIGATTAEAQPGVVPEEILAVESASSEEEKPVAETIPEPPESSAQPEKTVVSQKEMKANYPFFRGAEGNGIAYQSNAPVQWDGAAGTNILWKTKFPKHGFSSPIVWKNIVFITGADNASREVYCYDLDSGKLLWTAQADNIPGSPAQMPKVTPDTGLAAPTMATNGNSVFAIFATGDVLALDMDGKRLWAKNLGVPDNHYGHSSSLIIYKDKLLIQYDTNKGGKLIALSTASGDEIWTTVRKSKISWSSPILVNTGNRMELILTTDPNVDSYDPETGKELWSVKCLMGEVGPSAAYLDGLVFAANEYATFAAIKPGTSAEIVWQSDEYLPEVASPLAVNGVVIIATSYGMVAAFDTADGSLLWEHENSDGFYASPVYAGGNVYLIDMAGVCHIFKAGREFQLVAAPQLGEKSVCAPVFTDGKILIRGFDHLYCIGK